MIDEDRQLSKPAEGSTLYQVYKVCHAGQKPEDLNRCKVDDMLQKIGKNATFGFELEAGMEIRYGGGATEAV